MNISLAFDDSEVRQVIASGETLSVLFSAAHVQHTPTGVEGYLHALEMVFTAATWSGPLPDAIGRLRDGLLSIDGVRQRRFDLPFAQAGDVRAELTFHNGTLLAISAGGVALRVPGEPRFVESFAC